MSATVTDMYSDNQDSYLGNKVRLTQKEKDANDKAWYKSVARLLGNRGANRMFNTSTVSKFRRLKVNYDLFNNRINMKDFEYVSKPFGMADGQLPANFVNRDIVSGKMKVLLGMEMSMPYKATVKAVNEDATNRKKEEELSQLKDYVTSSIMKPIKMEIQKELMEKQKGKKLTFDEQQQIQQQVEEETKARTPEEVKKYMAEEHQDPAEILNQHLLNYLMKEEDVVYKFNKGWKHANLSGKEIYFVGELNGNPIVKVVNPLFFEHDMSPDEEFVHKSNWAVATYRMSPSEIVSSFGSELTNEEIDRIYSYDLRNGTALSDMDFTFAPLESNDYNTISVKHINFISLRKVGFVTSLDGSEDVVDENYKFNPYTDKDLYWDWIPQEHEVYQILNDIFVYARPVPGKQLDLENLYDVSLSYIGAVTDNMNSDATCPMDRARDYQYLFNIIVYRIELLMASDKGKILVANIKGVPTNSGIDLDRWQYFLEANKMAWLDPNEEGNKGGSDVTNMVKEIDMSLASDINQYIQLAEYIERKCGESIGITKQMEGAIGPTEAVTNTKQNLVQSSQIIKPYFELHNQVKKEVQKALLNVAKNVYGRGKKRVLSYVLDDMSLAMFEVDPDLLVNSTIALFIEDSAKAIDAKKSIESLAQAAMQNQQATLLDIVNVIDAESTSEARVILQAANAKAMENAQANEKAKQDAQEKMDQRLDQQIRDKWQHEKDMVILKAEEDRKTQIQKQAILSMGFDPNKDEDDDGIPDVLEVAKFGVDADIKMKKIALDTDKLDHQKTVDKEKLKLEAAKVQIAKSKPKATA